MHEHRKPEFAFVCCGIHKLYENLSCFKCRIKYKRDRTTQHIKVSAPSMIGTNVSCTHSSCDCILD